MAAATTPGDLPAAGPPPREGGRTPFARRHDDPQRVDGAGRWSVDATRRRCFLCSGALLDRHAYHSVLEPAPWAGPEPSSRGSATPGSAPEIENSTEQDITAEQDFTAEQDITAEQDRTAEQDLFVRRDYCEECFATSPPATAFAHWRAVLSPPPGGERKVVNLASLLAHFHALVETPDAVREPGLAEEGAERSAPPGGAVALSEPRSRLAYLLALFLVRRRMLRWEGVEEGILRLRCRESDRPVELAVPALTPAELEAAVAEFEELFR